MSGEIAHPTYGVPEGVLINYQLAMTSILVERSPFVLQKK